MIRSNQIYIWAIISPRLEIEFLEEWLVYHFSIGIDKILLYNNGFSYYDDSRIGNNYSGPEANQSPSTWSKKPNADYSTKTQAEILKKLELLENKFKKLEIKDWPPEKARSESVFTPPRLEPKNLFCPYPRSQYNGFAHARQSLTEIDLLFKKNLSPKWWFNIDPDEFLALKKHNSIQELINLKIQTNSILFQQVIFEQRKIGLPTLSLFNYYWPCNLTKAIFLNEALIQWSPHKPCVRQKARQFLIEREEAEIFHYRGFPWAGGGIKSGCPLDVKKQMRKLFTLRCLKKSSSSPRQKRKIQNKITKIEVYLKRMEKDLLCNKNSFMKKFLN